MTYEATFRHGTLSFRSDGDTLHLTYLGPDPITADEARLEQELLGYTPSTHGFSEYTTKLIHIATWETKWQCTRSPA